MVCESDACETEFEPQGTGWRRRYCSHRCRMRAYNAQHRSELRAAAQARRDADGGVADRAAGKRYYDRHSERVAQRDQRRRRDEPEKAAARDAVNRALITGRLVRGPCERQSADCSPRIEAHHDDYSRPLDVRWLCSKHHGIEHRKEPHATAAASG